MPGRAQCSPHHVWSDVAAAMNAAGRARPRGFAAVVALASEPAARAARQILTREVVSGTLSPSKPGD